MWDDETWHDLAARAVRLARSTVSLAVLPNALTARATIHVLAGELGAAAALIEEAYAIAEATGNTPLRYPSMMLAAWQGQEDAALEGDQDRHPRRDRKGISETDSFRTVRDRSAFQRPGSLRGSARRRRTRVRARGISVFSVGPSRS